MRSRTREIVSIGSLFWMSELSEMDLIAKVDEMGTAGLRTVGV